MTCRVSTRFVSHDLDFGQPTPMGFAQCRRCGGYYTLEQYLAWRCEGAPVEAPITSRRAPVPLHGVPCALCGDPVFVDPMHRAVVEWFGGTCDACFNLEPAHD